MGLSQSFSKNLSRAKWSVGFLGFSLVCGLTRGRAVGFGLAIAVVASSSWAHADYTHELRTGLATEMLAQPSTLAASQNGWGALLDYEFVLSPRFAIGIQGAYRLYSGLNQIGYGFTMRHLILGELGLNVSYGLLQQISSQPGMIGAAVSYDARLAAGWDFALGGVALGVELAYHFSRAGYLGITSLPLDYLEFAIGPRFKW